MLTPSGLRQPHSVSLSLCHTERTGPEVVLGWDAQVERICSRLRHICGAEGITVNRQVRAEGRCHLSSLQGPGRECKEACDEIANTAS